VFAEIRKYAFHSALIRLVTGTCEEKRNQVAALKSKRYVPQVSSCIGKTSSDPGAGSLAIDPTDLLQGPTLSSSMGWLSINCRARLHHLSYEPSLRLGSNLQMMLERVAIHFVVWGAAD
jgi:hypothetical protein